MTPGWVKNTTPGWLRKSNKTHPVEVGSVFFSNIIYQGFGIHPNGGEPDF